MDYLKVEEVQGWAVEKFGIDTKLGSLARMPCDVLTAEEVEMLHCAREGWLVGIDDGMMSMDGCETPYSCVD